MSEAPNTTSETTETPNIASENTNSNSTRQNRPNDRPNIPNRPQPFTNRRTDSKFKGKIEDIESLCTKDESKKNNFTKFKAGILQYILKNFSTSIDIVPALKAEKDPIEVFNTKAPMKNDIKRRLGLVSLTPPAGTESEAARALWEATNKDTDETVTAIWQAEIKMFVQKGNVLRADMAKLWSITKDQCSHSLKEELRAEKEYLEKERNYDVLWLLKTLQQLTSGITDSNNRFYSIYHAIKDFYKIRQGKHESLAEYFERFETAANLVTMSGGSVTNYETLLEEDQKTNPKERRMRVYYNNDSTIPPTEHSMKP